MIGKWLRFQFLLCREYANFINNFVIEKHSGLDKILSEKYEDLASNKAEPNLKLIGKILSNALSFSIYTSQSIIQEISLKNCKWLLYNIYNFYVLIDVFQDLSDVFHIDKEKIPSLAFCIFKCGKTMNSKVKYERFMLILNNSQKISSQELTEIISKIYTSIRKVLTSGKHGVWI